MTTPPNTITVTDQQAGQRLDIFCASFAPDQSRSMIQKAIKQGHCTVNDTAAKPSYTVKSGDRVTLSFPAAAIAPTNEAPLALPIVFEDRDVVVIDKPPGVATHAGMGRETQTVASWFLARYPEASGVGEEPGRDGVVHRLDKDTSGLLILAKNQRAYEHLKRQFQRRRAKKEYLALVFGVPGESSGRITRPLARSRRNPMRRTIDPAGKSAITEWAKEESFGTAAALLRVYPRTGRTHQIRVHLHFLGFPIVGDALYTFKRQSLPRRAAAGSDGGPVKAPRQLLHAAELTLELPSKKTKTFTAPLPPDFENVLTQLRTEA